VDDRLVQSLQESCDKWAPGIEIISIRITKPKIPHIILANYEAMEGEKTKLMVATQSQKVKEKESETEKMRATIEAEKHLTVSRISMEQQIMEKESQKKMKQLEDEALFFHEKVLADADFYRVQKVAEANRLLFTQEYIQLASIQSISNTTKVYFGPSLNNMFLEFVDLFTHKELSKHSFSRFLLNN